MTLIFSVTPDRWMLLPSIKRHKTCVIFMTVEEENMLQDAEVIQTGSS